MARREAAELDRLIRNSTSLYSVGFRAAHETADVCRDLPIEPNLRFPGGSVEVSRFAAVLALSSGPEN